MGARNLFKDYFSPPWGKCHSFIWQMEASGNRGKTISQLQIGNKDWTWSSSESIVLSYSLRRRQGIRGVFSKNVCPGWSMSGLWQHTTKALRKNLDLAAPLEALLGTRRELWAKIPLVMFITGLLRMPKIRLSLSAEQQGIRNCDSSIMNPWKWCRGSVLPNKQCPVTWIGPYV